MGTSNIQMISLELLHAHKDNPRKQLGDLSELSDSIKQNGIMQNLTVVPAGEAGSKKEGYTIIIGHRRAAAAKAAGLTEVPCAVVHMSYKKQLSIMLLENIQRNDLTVQEQAEGFQMMLDLGATVGDIARETGFSQTTVKHRLEIAKLDRQKLNDALSGRQVSLSDFAKLEELKDIKARERLLQWIGTSDFNYKLNAAIKKEAMDALMAAVLPTLEQFAKPFAKSDTSYYYSSWWECIRTKCDIEKIKIPEDGDKFNYRYRTTYDSIEIYRLAKVTEEEKKEKRKEKEKAAAQKEKIKILDEAAKKCYEARAAFIKSFEPTEVTQAELFEFVSAILLARRGYRSYSPQSIRKFFQLKSSCENLNDSERGKIERIFSRRKRVVVLAYAAAADDSYVKAHNYEGRYSKESAAELRRFYDALKILKYEPSEEELAYMEGKYLKLTRKEK